MLFDKYCYKHGKLLPSNVSLMVEKRVLQDKYGMTSAAKSGSLTLATWRLWRRNMGSQKCWNLLDISIRREDTLECTRRFHVTSRPDEVEYIRRALG
ncbi:hypothetical protein AVEN_262540-1 [Araneus ventricosus]|uniref:Uncharacterized protein n=1 Tax=Araneus ventricosus TaxID=182803 RepID=A0A4Y2VUT3_ARAVE|nr:hypothetical protein AVEN_262540-1 [Araneus ventricosus]